MAFSLGEYVDVKPSVVDVLLVSFPARAGARVVEIGAGEGGAVVFPSAVTLLGEGVGGTDPAGLEVELPACGLDEVAV